MSVDIPLRKDGLTDPTLISIVDDDESMREAVKSLIRSVGFRTETFSSAEQFLKYDYIEKIDCLILDVRMPGMSGLELQRQLGEAFWQTPIVFITAHEEARAQALKDGAVGFLTKPFAEQDLLNAITQCIEQNIACVPRRT